MVKRRYMRQTPQINLSRESAEARELNSPLRAGRLRTYQAPGSPVYVFDGREWWARDWGYIPSWSRCADVPERLWVSGNTSRPPGCAAPHPRPTSGKE